MTVDPDALRGLPSVTAVLARPAVAAAVTRDGRAVVVRAIREAIAGAREQLRAGRRAEVTDEEILARAAAIARGTLRPVLNGTGVIVHTNLGRAPLAPAAIDAVREIAAGYATLEYDPDEGARGERHGHARELLVELTGAEDALVVNNNAAGVLLALATQATGREVIVSRGELVEIGGGFRIPEVLTSSGAALVEVGTTNRTHLRDYASAIREATAVLLKVHRSNFAIVGFTAEVAIGELADLAKERSVPLFVDAGSGALGRTSVTSEPPVSELIEAGADVVMFSGDKLLGGPQAGIVVGKRRWLEPMRRHPLMRALRPDKMCLAALVATLRLWRDDFAAIPVVRMAETPASVLEARARRIADATRTVAVPTEGRIGGGVAPTHSLPSWAVAIAPRHGGESVNELAARLRRGTHPIVARIEDERLLVDLRCIPTDADAVVAAAIDALFDDGER